MTKWIAPVIIYVVCLNVSFYYALNLFQITSDSAREYQVYLQYVLMGRWLPIDGNMLSSSLWTTALPAFIQSLVKLPNPETVYRFTLAVLVSPLPAVIYILARKYTSTLISVALSFIFFSTFYYQGFAMYARMQVGAMMAALLLIALFSQAKHKYAFIALAAIGIAVSHYSVAYIYTILFSITSLGMIIYRVISKSGVQDIKPLIFTSALLIGLCSIWYYVVNPAPGHYAQYGFSGVASEVRNPSLNIFAGLTPDFVLGKVTLLIRLLFGIGIIIYLAIKKKIDVLTLMYSMTIVIGLMSITSQTIQNMLGAFRPSYILLPVEMAGISYWWGNRKNWLIWIPLGLWMWYYH